MPDLDAFWMRHYGLKESDIGPCEVGYPLPCGKASCFAIRPTRHYPYWMFVCAEHVHAAAAAPPFRVVREG